MYNLATTCGFLFFLPLGFFDDGRGGGMYPLHTIPKTVRHLVAPTTYVDDPSLFKNLFKPPNNENEKNVLRNIDFGFGFGMGDSSVEDDDLSTITTTTTVSLPKLLEEEQNHLTNVFPRFHPFSMFHYQRYSTSPYASKMSYPQFCLLEEKMSDIVFAYLGDQKRQWCIFLSPEFLYSDSIKSYGSTEVLKKTLWITPSIEIGNPDVVVLDDDKMNEFGT
jgi:hypothetical protein